MAFTIWPTRIFALTAANVTFGLPATVPDVLVVCENVPPPAWNHTKGVPVATEFNTVPPLPSTMISPPVWLILEPAMLFKLPLIVNVPAETFKVPELFTNMLFVPQPTVKLPELISNEAKAPIVMLAAKFPEEVEVILCNGLIITASVQVGTVLLLQVDAVFQSPEATEVIGTSDDANAK